MSTPDHAALIAQLKYILNSQTVKGFMIDEDLEVIASAVAALESLSSPAVPIERPGITVNKSLAEVLGLDGSTQAESDWQKSMREIAEAEGRAWAARDLHRIGQFEGFTAGFAKALSSPAPAAPVDVEALREALESERAIAYAQQSPEDYEEAIEATDAVLAALPSARRLTAEEVAERLSGDPRQRAWVIAALNANEGLAVYVEKGERG